MPWQLYDGKKMLPTAAEEYRVHNIAGVSLLQTGSKAEQDFFLEDPGANGRSSGIDLKFSTVLFALVLSRLWFMKCPLVQQLFQVANKAANYFGLYNYTSENYCKISIA